MSWITPLLLLGALLPQPAPAPPPEAHHGFASIYSPGVMERVARRNKLPQRPCMIATPLYNKVGTLVWVKSKVTGVTMRCQVTDEVMRIHMQAHMDTRHYVEFNNPTGLKMCRHKYAGQEPRRTCPVTIWR